MNHLENKCLVKQSLESLREIRRLKANELGPTVTQELDAVIQKLDEFSKVNPGKELPKGLKQRVMDVLAKLAATLPWVLRILGCENE